ncbi:MAG: ADP/ATP-dependent (S)-NAD(P)H-hydrate dehydratase, partial [Methanomicrobiaceae archaeon]|nr:ADP/ATP-dependent (S)-NAD(P)H-hydrate dehydratase [Methanomicrobiaceae archaeon]
IYTPHAGEFSRIFAKEPPSDLAARGRLVRASSEGATVLLKGHVDVISDGSRVRFNDTGHPAMTTGGTGDVLAGITGALFCRLPAFDAACIAAFVSGNAGAAAARVQGNGLVASDLLEYIPSELYWSGEE